MKTAGVGHAVRQRVYRLGATLLVLAGLVFASVSFWPQGQQGAPKKLANVAPDREIVLHANASATPSALAVAKLQPSAVTDGTEASGPLSEEWEERLFAVLELDGTSLTERNAQLVAMATEEAVTMPRVQQACLRHLAYGLHDTEEQDMLRLALDARIPLELRAEFVETLFGSRTQEICVWLAGRLQSAIEPALAGVARDYLGSFEAASSE